MIVKGTYSVKKWEENEYRRISDEAKMTRASVEYAVTGQIEGTASLEYLMYYKYFNADDPHKSSAVYKGLMRFEGKLNGKAGTFVVEDSGKFENGLAGSSLLIITGSGTGELKGIEGTGTYSATKDGAQIELDYTL
jgi:hypothetical protein